MAKNEFLQDRIKSDNTYINARNEMTKVIIKIVLFLLGQTNVTKEVLVICHIYVWIRADFFHRVNLSCLLIFFFLFYLFV